MIIPIIARDKSVRCNGYQDNTINVIIKFVHQLVTHEA